MLRNMQFISGIGKELHLLSIYIASTLFLPRLYLFAYQTPLQQLFPPWERIIPKLGTFHSQAGNATFPQWE